MPPIFSTRCAHLGAAGPSITSVPERRVRVILVMQDLNAVGVLARVASLGGLELVQHWPLNGLVELAAALDTVPALLEIQGVTFCYLSDGQGLA